MNHPTLQPPCCTSVGSMQLLHLGLKFELPNLDLISIEYIAHILFLFIYVELPFFFRAC